jgi:hypothetical protein
MAALPKATVSDHFRAERLTPQELDDAMPTIPRRDPLRAVDTSQGCPHCQYGANPCVCPKGLTAKEQAVAGASLANILVAAGMGLMSEEDMVNLPGHYARFKIEPVRFICDNGLNFFQGNVIKYILRSDAKNGLEDLLKAQRYLAMFIEFVKGNQWWWTKDFAAPAATQEPSASAP